jgi:hypothetical protein
MTLNCLSLACQAPATHQCFDCGRWYCDAHVLHIRMPTATGSFAETLCVSCLASPFAAQDRDGDWTLESLDVPSDAGSLSSLQA